MLSDVQYLDTIIDAMFGKTGTLGYDGAFINTWERIKKKLSVSENTSSNNDSDLCCCSAPIGTICMNDCIGCGYHRGKENKMELDLTKCIEQIEKILSDMKCAIAAQENQAAQQTTSQGQS